jgi:hypothetical protein
MSLDRMLERRTYRRHRMRWDAEPYGLAISLRWLLDRGARPVQYGAREDWDNLADSDRPFFQRRNASSRGSAGIDWTEEEEWRVLGPLDLAQLDPDEAAIFVASQAEAAALAPIAPWPVVAVR